MPQNGWSSDGERIPGVHEPVSLRREHVFRLDGPGYEVAGDDAQGKGRDAPALPHWHQGQRDHHRLRVLLDGLPGGAELSLLRHDAAFGARRVDDLGDVEVGAIAYREDFAGARRLLHLQTVFDLCFDVGCIL